MEGSHDILPSFQSLYISETSLDFGPQFASNKTPEEFVATINQYLKLHNSNKIDSFRLFFCPSEEFLPDIENWIAFAVAKGVEELDLDFTVEYNRSTCEFYNGSHSYKLPSCLFQCKSLTHLSLSSSDFYPPSSFTGFNRIQSLSLAFFYITDDILQCLLANCPLLHSLSLTTCLSLEVIKVSANGLRLQRLTIIDCWETNRIEICAPNLQSFIYNGEHIFWDSSVDVPSLEDAFISSLDAECSEPEHDCIKMLSDLSHVKILTVCTGTLMRLSIYQETDAESLPLRLPNLKELQILMSSMHNDDLAYIYDFFRLCPSPFIEKLFIQLPRIQYPDYINRVITVVEDPSDVAFKHLKAIKLRNFKGCETEMRLVRFVLDRAVVLESLLLVTPLKLDLMETTNEEPSDSKDRRLREQLALFPKASVGANIVLCESFEDDGTLTPTHTEYYCDFL